ncbi:MAG: ATP-binding protein, partial [Bacteroidia bacterium]|nr:ATP-binding protein [Bacteroidia bacterium]
NEEEYIAALDRVPRWNHETVKNVMSFHSRLALLISNMSYTNLKLAQSIEERNKVTEELKSNYSLLRMAGETAKFGGWSVDLANNKVIWSEEVAAIHEEPAGYSPSVEQGISYYAPEWRDKISRVFTDCAAKGIPYDEEMEIITARNNRIWVRGIGEAVRDKNGKIVKVQGAFQDINRQKKTENALKKSEGLLNLFMKYSPVYTFIKEVSPTQSLVLRASENYRDMIGIPGSEMEGKNMDELFTAEFAAKIIADDWQVVSERRVLVQDEELNGKSYTTIKFPIRADSQNLLAGFTIDITERKQAEQALVESEARLQELNATKDKFFSIIAHDLRSPFNNVIGFSDLLTKKIEEKDFEGVEKYAGIIQNSSQKAMDLLMNLLEWSRSQTGRMVFTPEQVDLVDLMNQSAELFIGAAEQKSISIATEAPSVLRAFADKTMMSTILRNLISNAIKFTHPGGHIVISAQQLPDELIIGVSDNGVGITKDTIDHLFQIDQSHSTLGTNSEKGTGLGLILCKEFIEKHGGKIWVESMENQGSNFQFSIPRAKISEAAL